MSTAPTAFAANTSRSGGLSNAAPGEIEISIVIPCLNEANTVGICVSEAASAIALNGLSGEIIVADNGSTDGSVEIARQKGALVVHVPEKGYGSALMGGIAAAQGRYVMIGDADASYDFGELPRFLEKLRQGCSLVQGCRLSSGGGYVMPRAMPFLHRWLGNPMFSFFARTMFRSPVHDINCGMRAFTKDLYRRLDQRCTGMEFAVEMVLKASLMGEKISEVPITLFPDQRCGQAPHLRTFRDGWRTLRYYLISCPRWLFLYPGMALVAFGLLGYSLALPGIRIGGVEFDVHTLLLASLSLMAGYQTILFSLVAKNLAISERLLPPDPRPAAFARLFSLERGLAAGSLLAGAGLMLVCLAFNDWRLASFGHLNPRTIMRLVAPGVLLIMLGLQTGFASFLLGILHLRRK